MEAVEYYPAALRTRIDLGEVGNRTHALLGMVTEAGEVVDIAKRLFAYQKPVDPVHLLEEIGDFLWYVALFCEAEEIDYAKSLEEARLGYNDVRKVHGELPLAEIALGLSTAPSEFLLREKDGAETVGVCLLFSICALAIYGMTIEQAQAANIAKLTARYPEKFTNDLALNRDLTAERGALEGANDR